jgi:transposase
MVTVGLDPHKHTHTVGAIGAAGAQLGRHLTVSDEASAVAKLLAWKDKITPAGEPVIWAIEDGRGLARRLATGLLLAGQQVVWVPVRLMVAERRHGTRRGKSDPIDALAVARAAANPDNARYLAPASISEIGRDLAHLVNARRDRVAARTRMINTLRWQLHELAGNLEPADLTTLRAPRLLATGLAELPPSVLRDLAINTCGDLAQLTTRINQLTTTITAQVSDLCPHLLAIPGVGPITAATILAETGDPTRIRRATAFARLNATAPIPVWTSNTERHRLDRGGNRRLNAAIHTVALTQARSYPPAQAIITKHQQNKGKRGAMRILKRHLSDVIYHALQTDTKALTCQHESP